MLTSSATFFVAAIVALPPALVLAFAGFSHLRHRSRFEGDLRRQSLVPRAFVPPLAVLVATLELLLGAATLVALSRGATFALPTLLLGSSALLAAFAVYAFFMWKTRPAVPCACSANGEPATFWTVARAAGLAGLAAAAAAAPVERAFVPFDAQVALAAVAGVAIALLVWQLPASMLEPTEQRRSA